MGVHYFGKRFAGKLGRFWGSFDDVKFEEALKEVGGKLPKGWVVWHFENGEDFKNSRRVQALAEIPEIKVRHWSGVYSSSDQEQVILSLIRDAANEELFTVATCANCGRSFPESDVRFAENNIVCMHCEPNEGREGAC